MEQNVEIIDKFGIVCWFIKCFLIECWFIKCNLNIERIHSKLHTRVKATYPAAATKLCP